MTTPRPTDVAVIRLGNQQPTSRHVVALPGCAVPLFHLDLPKGLRGQAREQVARRQLADRTGQAETALELRPMVGSVSQGAWSRVLAAAPEQLRACARIPCRAVLPDYLCLPAAAGVWTIGYEPPAPNTDSETAALLSARLGPEDGFSALPALAMAQLEQALEEETDRPRAILLTDPVPEVLRSQIRALAARHDIAVETDTAALSRHGLSAPRMLAHGELACDLRHNPMAARNRLARQLLPWRWPLLAAALAASLWAGAEGIALSRSQAELDRLNDLNQTLVRAHFVPAGPILDMRIQVSRALGDLRTAASAETEGLTPLALTHRAAMILSDHGLLVQQLRFQQGQGLHLLLRLTDFAAADRLAADLRAAGMQVTLRDLNVRDGETGVEGVFVLSPSDPTTAEHRP